MSHNTPTVHYGQSHLITTRHRIERITPALMHRILTEAGCAVRFDEQSMAVFTTNVGSVSYPLNPCGAHSRKWVEQACADQGFHRPCDIAALLVGAQVIATSNAIADAFERSPAPTAAPSDNLRALMEEIDLAVPQRASFTESGFGFAGGAQ